MCPFLGEDVLVGIGWIRFGAGFSEGDGSFNLFGGISQDLCDLGFAQQVIGNQLCLVCRYRIGRLGFGEFIAAIGLRVSLEVTPHAHRV